MNPMSEDWNGTYIGQEIPTEDYWHSIKVEDGRSFLRDILP
ncbi:hypothetical protein [Flavobacterium humidisoli]